MTLGVFWLHGVHRIAGNPDAPRGDYAGPEGYTAEFTCLTEETRAVVDLRPDQVRPAEEGEVAREIKGGRALDLSCLRGYTAW